MPKNKGSKKKNSPSKKAKTGGQKEARVFVANIPFDASIEDLKKYAGKSCTWVRRLQHQNGQFKGSAFFDFTSKQDAEKFLKKDGKKFQKRNLVIRSAELDGEKKSKQNISHFSVYVGGFSGDDEDELKEFIDNDNVKKIRFLKGKNEGVAFVNFNTAAEADKFVKKNGSTHEGSKILVKYASTNLPSCHVSGYPDNFNEQQMKQFVGAKKTIDQIRFIGEEKSYAFVDFKTIVACNQFLQKHKTSVGGKVVSVKLARGGNFSDKASVFIGNLPDSVDEAALEKFLGGEVSKLSVVEDSNIAFAVFANGEDAAKAKAKSGQKFKGKEILITTKNVRKQRKQNRDGSL